MSKTGRYNYRRPAKGRNQPGSAGCHITVRGVRKDPPDIQKLSRAIIARELEELDRRKASADDISDTPETVTPHANSAISPAHPTGAADNSEADHDHQ
jgi:hypothetical protein